MRMEEPRESEPFTVEQRLIDAVSRRDRPTIERALERGATLDAKDEMQRSTVLRAVLDAGDLELVRWLHRKGAALDDADVGGRTPLSFAAEREHVDIARYLVDNGAAVDRADKQGRTPLFHATLSDHPELIAFLADRGANVNVRDQYGDTPLIAACAKGSIEAAALLVHRGADSTIKDQEGRTAKQRSAPEAEVCQHLPQ